MEAEPELNSDNLQGSLFYWDGATNDAKLTMANIIDARNLGATTLSRVSLEDVEWNSSVSKETHEGHLLKLIDQQTGEELQARAKIVISAAGPWTDSVLKSCLNKDHHKAMLAPTRGSHIVVPQGKLPVNHAIVITHPKDGRVLFAIPWENFTVIGTTDIFDQHGPDQCHITKTEVQYLLDAANEQFPKAKLQKEDIVSVWSGLRPLVAPPDQADASAISREHVLNYLEPGMIVIAGGKLTTYRAMAEECVDFAIESSSDWHQPLCPSRPRLKTKKRKLPTVTLPFRADEEISPEQMPEQMPKKMIGESEAGRIDSKKLLEICEYECPLSLEDLMVRRLDLYYKESNNGLDLLPKLKAPLSEFFNWSEDDWQKEVQAYKSYLELSTWKALERKDPTK